MYVSCRYLHQQLLFNWCFVYGVSFWLLHANCGNADCLHSLSWVPRVLDACWRHLHSYNNSNEMCTNRKLLHGWHSGVDADGPAGH